MQDLNDKILLHPEIGIGVKYIDYDRQIEYDTLSKQAMRNQIMLETLSEEMRVLYVALTRAKEKLIITGYSKNDADKQKKIDKDMSRYNKINPILLKKYKSYMDWIRLVYLYNKADNLAELKFYKKSDIIKNNQDTDKNEIVSEEIIKQLNDFKINEQKSNEIIKKLKYEYPYKKLTILPNKTSITEIKNAKLNKEEQYEIEKPKFLQNDADIRITGSEKGTLIHLCMQKLDIRKSNYTIDDIRKLVNDLEFKQIITPLEAEAININKVYKFTQSSIWKDILQAKEVEREKPFYINLPANEVYGDEFEGKVLVQGIIDLYYIDKNDNLILVDYKTDYVENNDENILVDKYKIQLELYKRALESAMERKVKKMYIYSTYLNKEILIEEKE